MELSSILFVYSLTVILWSAFLSFIYTNPQRAASHSKYIYGFGTFALYIFGGWFPDIYGYKIPVILDKVFSFTPIYCLYYTLARFLEQSFPNVSFIMEVMTFTKVDAGYISSVRKGLICFGISAGIATLGIMLLVIRSQYKRRSKEFHSIKKKRPMINKNQKQVSEDSSESTIMKFANISKTYSDGFEALRDVSFTIPKKGIFGILGPNGAGKSTLFNIATLQLRRSDGDILIENKSIYAGEYNQNALCPQRNRYWEYLTIFEHLEFIAQLKGATPSDARKQVLFLAL